MSDPTLMQRAPGTLRPNPWNTNVVPPDLEARLEESIKRNGMFKPVVCRELADGTLEILGGEHRARVAMKLGHPTVPVLNLGRLPDAKAKEISLIDNARYGSDDTLQLAELLKELGEIEDIGTFLPYSDAELASIFSASSIALDELDIPDEDEAPAPSSDKPVQTHQILRFKVMSEDAERIAAQIEGVMKAQKFDQDDAMANAGNALIWLLNQKSKA